jgi:hypothetical protein
MDRAADEAHGIDRAERRRKVKLSAIMPYGCT